MKSNRTFGVEFELFFSPENLRRLFSNYKKIIPSGFGEIDQNPDDIIDELIINSSEIKDVLSFIFDEEGFGKWQLHEDGSVEGNTEDDFAIEVVTPILQGPKGIKEIQKFLSKIGAYAETNESCGLHVHVGANDFKEGTDAAKRITLALIQYGSLEQVFDKLVQSNRRQNENEYTQGINVEKVLSRYEDILATKTTRFHDIINLLSDHDRYFKLNIQSLGKHGTLEFRQMGGTLEPNIVINWIKVVTAFVDMIINTEKQFDQMFTELAILFRENKIDLKQGIPETAKFNKSVLNNHIYKAFSLKNFLNDKILSVTGQNLIGIYDSYLSEINSKTTKVVFKIQDRFRWDYPVDDYYFDQIKNHFMRNQKQTMANLTDFALDADIKGLKSFSIEEKEGRPSVVLVLDTQEYVLGRIEAGLEKGKEKFLVTNPTQVNQVVQQNIQKQKMTKSGVPQGMPSRSVNTLKKQMA